MKNTHKIVVTLGLCASMAAWAETGSPSAAAPGTTTESPSLSIRQGITDTQQALVNHGFSLSVDGRNGPATRNAIRQFQSRNGLPETGEIDSATESALRSGSSPAPSASDTSAQ